MKGEIFRHDGKCFSVSIQPRGGSVGDGAHAVFEVRPGLGDVISLYWIDDLIEGLIRTKKFAEACLVPDQNGMGYKAVTKGDVLCGTERTKP